MSHISGLMMFWDSPFSGFFVSSVAVLCLPHDAEFFCGSMIFSSCDFDLVVNLDMDCKSRSLFT